MKRKTKRSNLLKEKTWFFFWQRILIKEGKEYVLLYIVLDFVEE
jgi:hypothetical protein